ncbi:MAG TPA: SpoIVB peptidase S55 domain-containing protein, partial [Vicinamibacterales bacterium]|nr:SpoIVB peptidase S55 domain-containing protein [Vicinamibacterales bacterium]
MPFRLIGPVATVGLALALLATPAAQTTFMPVSEVKAGMVGIGRTVFVGDKLEEFRANILGVLKNAVAPGRDLILAKLEGGPLATTGVIAGMSGSPVYIENRLIGAVSYSLGSFAREPIAGITPIAEMVNAVQSNGPRAVSSEFDLVWPATPEKVFASLGRVVERAAAPLRSALRPSDVVGSPSLADWAPRLRPIGAAMIATGLTADLETYLRQALPSDTALFRGDGENTGAPAAMTQAPAPHTLRPGDAVGVSLMRGDLEMGATGTVTHVDGKQVYAFGHPFLNLGPTSMPMTRAQILTVLPSLDSSMKIGMMGPVIGRLTQDRSTAVGGVLGAGPNELAVHLTLESQGSAPRHLQFQVLHDQSLTPLFAYVSILNSLITYQRQTGATTITANGAVTFDGLGVLPIDDMFSGEQAISLAAASAMTPIGAMAGNTFRPALPKSLDLTLRVSEVEDYSTIERIWLDTTRPTLGGTHTLHVLLRNFRGSTEVVSLPVVMPSQVTGPVTLLVTDGTTLNTLEQKELRPATPQSLEALFARLRDARSG